MGTNVADAPSQRDQHIQLIAARDCVGWRKAIGCRHNLVEAAIGCYKSLIGHRMRARTFSTQQGEVATAIEALNRLIRAAKPISVRTA